MPANDEKITSLNTAWEGRSGARVEEFIKQQLKARAGVFHYDTANNRYLVFSDSDDRDLYLIAPENHPDLLLGTFDAPFNFEAQIYLTSPFFMPILKGSKGNYIDFTFDVKNKSGQSTGEEVVIVFTFRHAATETKVTEKYRHGASVHFCIDDYISDGTNNITVAITGQESLAATTVGITAQVIDLQLSDFLDPGKFFDLRSDSAASLEVPFSVSGSGTKVMEWFIDGQQLPAVTVEDEITSLRASRTKVIDVSGLTYGAHSVQFRAYTVINGERYYSQTLYREFAVNDGSQASPLPVICLAATLPTGSEIIPFGEPLTLAGVVQYAPTELLFAVHNFTGAASASAEVAIDGEIVSSVDAPQDRPTPCVFSPSAAGEHVLTISVGGSSVAVYFNAAETSMDIAEITSSLALALRAAGRTNNDSDRDSWSYKNYGSKFSGFYWNETSGWNDSRLLISPGASVEIDFAPLATNPTAAGLTMEFELMTRRVSNDDAVICDLTDDNGTGLLITASEARLRSAAGREISARFKEDDNVRIAVVINRATGSSHRGLAFIYLDGILSQAVDYPAADSFLCQKKMTFVGSDEAQVSLKDIRVYRTALTPDQVLNNFILYRDSVAEMSEVYDRNDIFFSGSDTIDPDKVASRVPVKLITGAIPTLEATTDKKLAIVVDSEYTNLQDPSLQYKTTNEQMTPQGTSSMSYPKKNFREYTNKRPDTVFINNGGQIVVERLYAFAQNSIPVDCWCDKADYAESSGAHNTGVARLWNQVMFDAQVDGDFPLRTAAQKAAIASGYPYDVRTAIDGFPIVMFYRLTAKDSPIFMGKYNFNNDKSTENVFGFRDIPGFNASKVQCWETLNNGHHLALFQDTRNWSTEWADAFESRYPDGSTDTAALKRLADWLTSVTQEDFATQKFDYFDVPKLAAYYIYLMRFGAVDQPVKNSMLTTEDGLHWYFINYDNDTVMGLRNDGYRKYGPFITRQSLDPDFPEGVYAYAGHDSRLWNLFEGDIELMKDIVPKIDDALYAAGLSYDKAIDMFDRQQSGKWCERIYNRDAEYKYLGPYLENGVNNLFMLQGARSHHRRWWLSKRFNWIDGMWSSGAYRANVVELKMAGAPTGITFSVGAGVSGFFGYGVNNVRVQTGVSIERGLSHEFSTEQVLNVGDPLRIYNAVNIASLDIHNFAPYLSGLNLAGVVSEALGTKLTMLLLGSGKGDVNNTSLSEISGLDSAANLETLNIRGYKSISALDLTANTNLRELLADGSGLAAVIFAPGAPLQKVELPDSMQAVTLANLPSLDFSGLTLDTRSLRSLEIRNCPGLLDSYAYVRDWLAASAGLAGRSLILEGVRWTDVDADEIITLFDPLKGAASTLYVTGSIQLKSCNFEQGDKIMEVFGEHCFEEGAALRFYGPGQVYISAPSSITAGESVKIRCEMFPPIPGTTRFSLASNVEGISISADGILTSDISTSDRTVIVNADFTAEDGTRYPRQSVTIRVAGLIGISSVSIDAPAIISEGECRIVINPSTASVPFTTQWEISDTSKFEIVESDDTRCRLRNISGSDSGSATLEATVTDILGNTRTSSATVYIVSQSLLDNCIVFDAEGVVNIDLYAHDTTSGSFSGIGFSPDSPYATNNNNKAYLRTFKTPDLPKGSKIYIFGADRLYGLRVAGMGASGVLDLQEWTRFTSVDVAGTSFSEVRLCEGSEVSTLKLPDTLEKLWLRNFSKINYDDSSKFFIGSAKNVRELIMTGYDYCTPANIRSLVEKSGGPEGFRLHVERSNNLYAHEEDSEALLYLAQCSGVDLNGYPEDSPSIFMKVRLHYLEKWENLDCLRSIRGISLIFPSHMFVVSAEDNGNLRFLCETTFESDGNVDYGTPYLHIDLIPGSSVRIDWGDGSGDEISESSDVSHKYVMTDSTVAYHLVEISDSQNISSLSFFTENKIDRYFLNALFSLGEARLFPSFTRNNLRIYGLNKVPDNLFQYAPEGYTFEDLQKVGDLVYSKSNFSPVPKLGNNPHFIGYGNSEIADWIVEAVKKSPEVTSFEGFMNQSNLTSIPAGLFENSINAEIFDNAFGRCSLLVNKRWPENFAPNCNFESIFYKNAIGTLVVTQSVPPPIKDSGKTNLDSIDLGNKIYVPDESVDDYKSATGWKYHKDYIFPMSQLPPELA